MIDHSFTEKARSRYTGTFKGDGVFDCAVRTGIAYEQDCLDQFDDFVDKLFNIEKSSGLMLDLIGKIVGQDRVLISYTDQKNFGFLGHPLAESFGTKANPNIGGYWKSSSSSSTIYRKMADDTYRTVLKARIASNISRGTINDFLRVINILTGHTRSQIIEGPESGSVTLVIPSGNATLVQYYYTRIGQSDQILPIPVGVSLKVIIVEE